MIATRKGIILLSFLTSMMLAAVYIFFAKPVYKASAHLSPPQQQDIQGLLIDYRGIEGIDVIQYNPQSVYIAFLNNLKSQGVRREFFDNYELIKHYAAGETTEDISADRVFENLFNERFEVQVDAENTENSLFVTVTFSDGDPIVAAQWLNQIIDFANKRTVQRLFGDVDSAIQAEIGKIRFQIDSKLKLAERRRLDKIVILKEALLIAKALGIQDASTFAKMAEKLSRD